MTRVCCYCGRIMGYTEPHGPNSRPTHGCCEPCRIAWDDLIDQGRFHEIPRPPRRAGVPACMRRAGI